MMSLIILPFLFTGITAQEAPTDDLRAKLAGVYVKAADLLVSKQASRGAWRLRGSRTSDWRSCGS